MPTIRIKIESELHAEYAWVFSIFGDHIGFKCEFVNEGEDILIAEHGLGDIQLSHFFRATFLTGNYEFKSYFRKEPLHYTASGKPDYLSTCFYLLSYLQEYTDYTPDKYDRFPYEISFQKHFNCVEENLVAGYFDALYAATPKLRSLVSKQHHPAKYFLSHDIDSVYGCLGDHYRPLIKQGRIGLLLQLIFNHYLRTPDYMLLDRIMNIEDEFDVKSTFFWIVNRGRGNRVINNADYFIDHPKIRSLRQSITARGFSNGVHKSVSKLSHADEFAKLGKDAAPINRNHYLRMWLPDTFDAIEAAGLKADATMGFAEAIGFRNNYGLPVQPYNLKQKKAYSFVELPLQVMDSTLKYYMHQNSADATKTILGFLERNKENALISILWHNNYFFDHLDKGWLDCYKSILGFIKENGFEVIDRGVDGWQWQ